MVGTSCKRFWFEVSDNCNVNYRIRGFNQNQILAD